jgi:SulP family sulfate permease
MTANLVKQLLPFLNWPRVDGRSLSHDFFAGVAVSLLAIPQSLAYAQLAGVPAYYGLYAAFIPSIVAVLFGSSALLSTGPVAMTSLLTAASVSHITPPGTAEFVSYVTLLALLSGLFQIGFGLARAGVLLNLLSHPVLMGFINAAALIIALSQLSALTGIAVPQTDHFLVDIWHVLSKPEALHGMSLAFGLFAMLLLYGFRRLTPQLPGVLIMVMILTGLSYSTSFAEHGGSVVGVIPTGLPSISAPAMSWRATMALLPAAFVIALISFMEAMSSSKVIALKTRTGWDENQELIGQGLLPLDAGQRFVFPFGTKSGIKCENRIFVAGGRRIRPDHAAVFHAAAVPPAKARTGSHDRPCGGQPDRPFRLASCLAGRPRRRHRRGANLFRHPGLRAQYPERNSDRNHLLALCIHL